MPERTLVGRRTGRGEGSARPAVPAPVAMGVGLLVSGAASYAFLSLSARALGPERFAPLSVLWAVLFVAGPGLFQPVEQELSRSIAARRALGQGHRALLVRAATLAAGLLALSSVATLLAGPYLVNDLFAGEWALLAALLVGVAGYAASHVVRGQLAGTEGFGRYASWFVADGLVKAVPCAALLAIGTRSTAAYAAVLALAAVVGAVVAGRGRWDTGPADMDPAAPWQELTRSMGHLLATSLAVAALLNAGTVAVAVLAGPDEADRAGIFLTGLVIARVPLFFYQAVQATLLPRLTHLAASQRTAEFRRGLARVMAVLAALTVLAVIGSLVLGTWTVTLMFGPDYGLLTGKDMALLALSSMLAMGALTLGQALIAVHRQALVWWPWLVGLAVFALTVALGSDDLFLRVELAAVASSAIVLVLMAVMAVAVLRRPLAATLDPDDVIEAIHEFPLDSA